MRYFIQLSYNGGSYHGWQRQPNAVTVQQLLEEALSTVLRMPITTMGAGRTDTGVHAMMMMAHVEIDENTLLPEDAVSLPHKLNSFLPSSIAVQSMRPVSSEAHARFNATSRSYVYRVSPEKNPFTNEAAYFYKLPLDIAAMNEAAKLLLDYKDFECFSRSKTDVRTYLCDITEASWTVKEGEYHFTITADRFLRNMVRAIVGTLLEIGQGKHPVSWMHDVIQSKNRAKAGASAPAHGLYLTNITYPKILFID